MKFHLFARVDSYKSNINIVELDKSNLDQFFDLFEEILKEDFVEYSQKHIEYFLNDLYSKDTFLKYTHRKTLVYQIEGQLVGFVSGDNTFGGVGYVSWLGIKGSMRRRGFGKALLEKYAEYCRQQGGHMIEVVTFSRNREFYERLGFKYIGEREKGYFGVQNVILNLNLE